MKGGKAGQGHVMEGPLGPPKRLSPWRDLVCITQRPLATPGERHSGGVPEGKLEEELVYKVDPLCKNVTCERSPRTERYIGRHTDGDTYVQRSQGT